MRNPSISLCALVLVVTALMTGCTTAVKEGIGVARGAKGLYAPVRAFSGDKESRPLGEYRRFEIGEISDEFGGNVPGSLLPHFRAAFAQELAAKKLPNDPSGKTLLIRGRILHYEDSSTLGVALGPIEEVVARMDLLDKESGEVLGTANCIGRTTTRVNLGVAKKAEGLAKAVVSWLDSRYPEENRLE